MRNSSGGFKEKPDLKSQGTIVSGHNAADLKEPGNRPAKDTDSMEKISQNVLVIGIGNILLSDEGAGVKAVEILQERFHLPDAIEVIDGGTIGMELLPYLLGRSSIIFIDAVKAGYEPGTVTKIEDLPAFFQTRTSPHQIGIIDVLALAAISENGVSPKTLLFGIEPASLDTGIGLSEQVTEKMDYLVNKVVEELKKLGLELQPRQASSSFRSGTI